MAHLSPASAAAIARLRTYAPPPTTWYSLPLSRRAAVLILLFADKRGDLRVVLTMRAATLKSYAGQAALPGGKTDSLLETPLMTARREAFEEIGLPEPEYPKPSAFSTNDAGESMPSTSSAKSNFTSPTSNDALDSPATPSLPHPFRIEHLCQLPMNLAKTELGVRPVVAFLHTQTSTDKDGRPVDVAASLMPRLDAKEVAAVFSGPLHNFLRINDELSDSANDDGRGKPEGDWYEGQWIDWHETRFKMHNFFVPVSGQVVARPKADQSHRPSTSSTFPYRDAPPPFSASSPDPLEALSRFRVFGMTARILVDCARVAYAEEPEFEHNSGFGDEQLINRLLDVGRMGEKRAQGDEFGDFELRRLIEARGKL
ncbi:MAG: hypothetical protein M1828_001939 [Chrysothrix sp. TS-e1954]|nr:MAG: hypothetical protein M1828_001939 [Chrysothrix sp. TS-e1954]